MHSRIPSLLSVPGSFATGRSMPGMRLHTAL